MGKKNENQEKEKINIKDIHETYWRCRDFEISNLWQRSIFLTAFLLMCFTAYGTIGALLFIKDNSEHLLLINVALGIIAVLGIIFSILWIKMGKGSKAWYEVYEKAIIAFETNDNYTDEEAVKIGGFNYNKIVGYSGLDINNRLLNNNGGEYSVSRINIAIGQVFMIFWLLVFIINTVAVGYLIFSATNESSTLNCFYCIGVFLIITLIIFIGHPKIFHSDALKYKKLKNRSKK